MDKPTKDTANMPKHIAIIPDGNRRWAKEHALAAYLGHQKGSEILENLLDILIGFDIPHFSFWGSSQDNHTKRPQEEVQFLLKIFKQQYAKLADDPRIHDNEIKINIFGSWRKQFPEDVKVVMENAIERTKNYSRHHFNSFIAYSGTDEIIEAAKNIARLKAENPEMKIDGKLLKNQLLTKDLPPVDLMIRTGGEPHNSDGFMMWDVANSQLVFSPKLWPDFSDRDLADAITEYSLRERRLGK